MKHYPFFREKSWTNRRKLIFLVTSLVAQTVKHLPTMQETQVWSLGWEDPLEKEIAPHSSTLALKISWMEEPGRLQSTIFLKAPALLFRPFVMAGWISVVVFILSGSSRATNEIRNYVINSIKKPIWVQPWSSALWRCFSYKGNYPPKFYNIPINSFNAYLPSPAMCKAL